MGKNRVKYPEGPLKLYLIGANVRESNYWTKTNYLMMKGDKMVKDYSNDQNNEDDIDLEGISQEVDKFLEEKEKHIRETIIGARTIEELEDFTLDVGIKKTYLCTRNTKESFPVLAKVVELFIKVYGATVTMYPKGDKVCLELVTPKREL
jgi:hypothetical protein